MINQFDKQMRDKMERQAKVTQECVNSWSGSDLYDCFREVTDCIHSIENREGFRKISVIKDVCLYQITGLGKEGYLRAASLLLDKN